MIAMLEYVAPTLGAVVLWQSVLGCVVCAGMQYNNLDGLERDYLNTATVCSAANKMAVPEVVASGASAALFILLGYPWTGCGALLVACYNAWRWHSGALYLEETEIFRADALKKAKRSAMLRLLAYTPFFAMGAMVIVQRALLPFGLWVFGYGGQI